MPSCKPIGNDVNNRNLQRLVPALLLLVCFGTVAFANPANPANSGVAPPASAAAASTGAVAWWAWTLILFGFTFLIGLIAPVSGVGGSVLFVPLATALFPFNVDFVRGTGLIMALVSAQSSAPHLVRKGLANMRVIAPVVTVSMVTSVIGGLVGLWVTSEFETGKHWITLALGVVLLVVFGVMLASKKAMQEGRASAQQDRLSAMLSLTGAYYEPDTDTVIRYAIRNLPMGVVCFAGVGFVAGMFGLGAGWANVPVLCLIMGAPIKVATSTSMAIITVNDAAAAWTYMTKGALLPVLIVPCVAGVSIGARIGARIAAKAKPRLVAYLVMGIMLMAAILDVYKGLAGLGTFG